MDVGTPELLRQLIDVPFQIVTGVKIEEDVGVEHDAGRRGDVGLQRRLTIRSALCQRSEGAPVDGLSQDRLGGKALHGVGAARFKAAAKTHEETAGDTRGVGRGGSGPRRSPSPCAGRRTRFRATSRRKVALVGEASDMSKTSSTLGIARGAGLILIGVGLAPLLSQMLIYFAAWQLLARGATEDMLPTLKTSLVIAAELRTLLVLAILPGVWLFAPGWSPRLAAARVLSVVGVLACAANAFMVRMSAPADGVSGTGAEQQWALGAAAAKAVADASLTSVPLGSALTSIMYAALALVCASIAADLGRKPLCVLAIVSVALCCAHVVAVSASFGPRLLTWLNFGVWLTSVICLWRTRKAAMGARA